MAVYRATRRRTLLPSHVKPSPLNLGSASQGKLSADEWISTSRYLLPLTLVPLWGGKEAGRERELLDNYMHLVSALRLADLRATTCEVGKRFRRHYKAYLHGILKLFPLATLKPTHHMYGHTPEFLQVFGPIRHWSAWVFEFLNGLAQLVRHNWKDGLSGPLPVLIDS